jgi:fructose-bisphosphate aldolase, class II
MSIAFYSMVPLLLAAEEVTRGGRPAAIVAYNINFWGQSEGISVAARKVNAPIIYQASNGANAFQGGPEIIAGMARDSATGVIASLHLDHGNYESAAICIRNGYSSAMIDWSTKKRKEGSRIIEEKRSDFENAFLTRPIVLAAHERGISVEGEMGVLAGIEVEVSALKSIYPTAKEVLNYCQLSGVDAVAVACGTSHGAHKRYSGLERDLLIQSYNLLRSAGLSTSIVLHGSSTVPKILVDEVNMYGGTLIRTSGIPLEDLQWSLPYVNKINIDSDLRLAITATIRKFLHENPDAYKKSPLVEVINAVFSGKTPAYEKGELINPGNLMDPRSYLQPVMELDPKILREDYRKTNDEVFIELMALISKRISEHVGFLSEKLGAAGLADRVEEIIKSGNFKPIT